MICCQQGARFGSVSPLPAGVFKPNRLHPVRSPHRRALNTYPVHPLTHPLGQIRLQRRWPSKTLHASRQPAVYQPFPSSFPHRRERRKSIIRTRTSRIGSRSVPAETTKSILRTALLYPSPIARLSIPPTPTRALSADTTESRLLRLTQVACRSGLPIGEC